MRRSLVKPGTIYRPASRIAGVLRRGHKQDLSGFLAIHPCVCLAPRPRPRRQDLTADGLVGAAPGLSKPKAPACNRSRGSLTRLWHLLSTLHERRCRSHARLASAGGLRLFREGVEPSGSLQKVSGYISILLLRPLPDASLIRLQEDSVPRHHGVRRAAGCSLCGLPSESPTGWWVDTTPSSSTFRPVRLHRVYW